MKTTLGALNPFRYRGYVWDEETGLYYLRTRYYDPAWGRFINADNMLGKTGRLLTHNVFAYCANVVVSAEDTDGTDAYWITDVDSAFRFGHTSLLLEDAEGQWYYFYWGPQSGLPFDEPLIKVEKINLNIAKGAEASLQEINDALHAARVYEEELLYDDAILLKGDYTESLAWASQLKADVENKVSKKYNVLYYNCMKVSAQVLQRSHDPKSEFWGILQGLRILTIPLTGMSVIRGWYLQSRRE